ncbi:MAG: hypothetical protein AAF559_14080 [Pseudomonadota bacterium]
MAFTGSLRLKSKKKDTGVGPYAAFGSFDNERISQLEAELDLTPNRKSGEIAENGEKDEKDYDDYTDRLTKLFPVEGVTLFPMAVGIANEDEGLLLALVCVITLVVGVLRWLGTRDAETGSSQWLAIAVSIIAFGLYAFTLGGFEYFFNEEGQQQRVLISSFITVIFTSILGAMDFVVTGSDD